MAGRFLTYANLKDVHGLDIPSHWILSKVKYIGEYLNGYPFKPDNWSEDGVPIIRIQNLSNQAAEINKTEFLPPARYKVEFGDILISWSATLDVYIWAGQDAWLNQHIFKVSTNTDLVHNQFFYWAAKWFMGELNESSHGSTMQHLTADKFGGFNVPLPSIKEQETIANFLDHETAKIDTLIEKQQQLIQLLKEKRQAVISHAVTRGLSSLNGGPSAKLRDSGVEWLGEVPEHWGIGKVKNLASIISKGTTPSTMGSDFESTGIRFLKAENVGKGFYVASQPEFYISEKTDEQLSRSRLQSHDVLVIIAGATTGQSSVMPDDLLPANTNQAVSFIRPASSSYSSYISFWLSIEYAQSKIWQVAVQAAQPNLSMESLGNIYIPIPPEHELDELIANINFRILQLSRLTESAELAINLMQERRTALISAAVTGKIDVRDWVAPQTGQTNKEVAA